MSEEFDFGIVSGNRDVQTLNREIVEEMKACLPKHFQPEHDLATEPLRARQFKH